MNEVIEQSKWYEFLKFYSEKNAGRITRLGVYERGDGFANDFWLEDGLRLVAVDLYAKGGRWSIEIMLENYNHSINEPAHLCLVTGESIYDAGLDITDQKGKTTMLRLEDAAFRVS